MRIGKSGRGNGTVLHTMKNHKRNKEEKRGIIKGDKMNKYTESLMKKHGCDRIEELDKIMNRDRNNQLFRHDMTGQDEECFNED